MKQKVILIGLGSLVGIMLLFWVLTAANIITLGIQREVRQQSQQYTETKAALLSKLMTDWLQLDAEIAQSKNQNIISAKRAQQKSIINRMRLETDQISGSEVPRHVKAFLATHK